MAKRRRPISVEDYEKHFEQSLARVAEVSGLTIGEIRARYHELLERSKLVPRDAIPIVISRKRGGLKVTTELDPDLAIKFSVIKAKMGLTSNASVVKALIELGVESSLGQRRVTHPRRAASTLLDEYERELADQVSKGKLDAEAKENRIVVAHKILEGLISAFQPEVIESVIKLRFKGNYRKALEELQQIVVKRSK